MDLSIVIPAHDAGPYVEDCLRSVAAADLRATEAEIVVVDDASQDDTAARVQAFAADCPLPLTLMRSAANVGAGQARAMGLSQARGRFIAFVDADDLVVAGRFADQLQLFSQDRQLLMCGGDLVEWDGASGKALRALAFPTGDADIRADLMFYCALWAGTAMFRRELLHRVAYPTVRIGEDWLFAFEAAQVGRLASTGKPAIYYRLHPQQATADASAGRERVLWIWRHMLQRIGLQPTDDELQLHAMCSPYMRTNPATVPEFKQAATAEAWTAWSAKLGGAAVDYAGGLRERCARILQVLHACRLAEAGVMRMF